MARQHGTAGVSRSGQILDALDGMARLSCRIECGLCRKERSKEYVKGLACTFGRIEGPFGGMRERSEVQMQTCQV